MRRQGRRIGVCEEQGNGGEDWSELPNTDPSSGENDLQATPPVTGEQCMRTASCREALASTYRAKVPPIELHSSHHCSLLNIPMYATFLARSSPLLHLMDAIAVSKQRNSFLSESHNVCKILPGICQNRCVG